MTVDPLPTPAWAPLATEGLLAKATRIRTLAETVRDAQRLAVDADRYVERLGHVHELQRELARLEVCQGAFVRAGIPFEPSRKASNYDTSAAQFESAREAFRDEPTTIFERPYRDAQDRARNLTTGLEGRLKSAWTAHVDATVPTPARDQLDVFAQIPAFRAVTERLRELYAERKGLREALPTSDDDVGAPVDLADQIHAAWGQLGGGAPEPVLDLLRQAADGGGAPLDALTPDVRDWLDANGVTDALRIRIS